MFVLGIWAVLLGMLVVGIIQSATGLTLDQLGTIVMVVLLVTGGLTLLIMRVQDLHDRRRENSRPTRTPLPPYVPPPYVPPPSRNLDKTLQDQRMQSMGEKMMLSEKGLYDWFGNPR